MQPVTAAPVAAPLAIICPNCRGPLENAGDAARRCRACGADFPARAAVPVLLNEGEWLDCRGHLDAEAAARVKYADARRSSPMMQRYFDVWVARMLGEIPAEVGGAFVELMCGGAEVCRRLPQRFTTAVALDLDVDMVEQAARDLTADTRLTFVCGTAARLPLPDACTPVVVVQGALHHARPVLGDVLREIHRILQPGGVLVGSEPANDNPLTHAVREWQYRHSTMQGHDAEEEGFDRTQLGQFLAAAGLRLDRYQQFGFVAYPLMGNTDMVPLLRNIRAPRLGTALLALDALLERIPGVRRLAWASLFRAFK